MSHKFDPRNSKSLDSSMRREILPPEETLKKLGPWENQFVADIGCGSGYFTIPMARLVGDRGHVYALDISPELLKEARKKAENSRIENITFYSCGENNFPLEDGQADTVFLSAVVHEVDNAEYFFREVKRVLKNKGLVKIVEWKKENILMGPPVNDRISEGEMIKLLKENGFSPGSPVDLGPGHYGIISSR